MHACKLIRDQLHYEALSCINPDETELGFRVNTLVTYRGLTIYMKFLEREEGISLYSQDRWYYLYKGRNVVWDDSCPPTVKDVSSLCSDQGKLLLMHSAFCFMMRTVRADAGSAARGSAAAYAAAAAARAAHAAAAVRAAAHAAAAVDINVYTAVAATVYAARAAFRELIKFRRGAL